MQQSSDGISDMRKIEWLHVHNALLQSALLNQTAWKRGTLSFQMTLIYHAGLCCFCSSSVLVYGSVDTAAQCLLTLHNPEGCPVLCLKHSARFLFAGLRNGTMMVYGRSSRGKVPPRLLCLRTAGCSFCCSSQCEVCRVGSEMYHRPPVLFFFLFNLALEECGKTWQRMKSRLIQKGKNVFVTTFSKYYFRKRVVTVNEACLCYCVRIPAFTLRSYQFSTTTIRQAGCNHVTITYISNADMRLIQCLLPFDFC